MHEGWILLAILTILYVTLILLMPASNGVVVILGSGGHTAEMLRILPPTLPNVTWIVAYSDKTSLTKLPIDSKVVRIPRARNVHQWWITTPFTTIYSFVYSFWILIYFNPRLIASNGPGTAVPLMLAAYLLRRVKLADSKLLYIETFARVKELSFSAKILYRVSDKFIVQWPDLQRRYPKADFYGHLV